MNNNTFEFGSWKHPGALEEIAANLLTGLALLKTAETMNTKQMSIRLNICFQQIGIRVEQNCFLKKLVQMSKAEN
jgi:hypothetical protein